MEWKKEELLADGTKIRIEDWSEDYSFLKPYSMVSAYPISKSVSGEWIKEGKPFRLELDFDSEEEATTAHANLVSGKKVFRDYLDNIDKSYHKCI